MGKGGLRQVDWVRELWKDTFCKCRRNGNEGTPWSMNSRKAPEATALCILAAGTWGGGQSHEYSDHVLF